MPWQSYRFSGFVPDAKADAVPLDAWTTLTDMAPRGGIQERMVGYNDAGVTGAFLTRPQWANPFRSATPVDGILYAGDDIAGPRFRLVRYLTTGVHTDITPAFWAVAPTLGFNSITGGSFGTGVLVSQERFQPTYIDNAGVATNLVAATPLQRFAALRPYKYMAVGISEISTATAVNTVRWSASAVPGAAPGTFVPAAGNDAGSVDLTSAGQGLPVDGGQLGEDFIIYGENAMWVMTYVGGATVMAVRRISSDTGIAFRNCWAEIPGGHVVMTKDDVVLVNQTGIVRSLVDGRLRQTIFANLMGSTLGTQLLCQVWNDRVNGRVWICKPRPSVSAMKLGIAYVYEIASDTWGQVSLSLSGDATDQIVGAVTANLGSGAPATPQTYVLDQGDALATCSVRRVDSWAGGSAQPASVAQRDDLDLGDASAFKVVRGLRVRGTATGGMNINVTVGSKAALDEAYTYGTTQTVALGTSQFVPVLAAGRWFSVKVQSSAAGDDRFKLHGFDLEYTARGNW